MRFSLPPLPLGRFLGAPIYVTASWFLFVLVIVPLYARQLQSWLGTAQAIALGAVMALMWGLSVLLHEFGHVAAARAMHFDVERVELGFMGGATTVRSEDDSPRSELVVSAAGPAVSLAIGLPGAISLITGNGPGFGVDGAWGMLLSAITLANLAIGVFNLLPGLPLDGGRVAVAVLWKATGNQHKATIMASYFGQVISAALAAYALWRVLSSTQPSREIPWVLAIAIMSASLWAMATASRDNAIKEARLAGQPLYERLMPVPVLDGREPAASASIVPDALVLVRTDDGLAYADRAVVSSATGTLADHATLLPEHRLLAEDASCLDLLHAIRRHEAPWFVVLAADDVPLGIVGAQALVGEPVALTE
ncbi:MAG: site-2 protease family protein [Cumulibacter sp.]